MVRTNTLGQKVVKCGASLLLECPHAAVDVFNIINDFRTKQMTFTRGTNPIKFVLVICTGMVCIQMKTFTAGMFFISCIHALACIVFIRYFQIIFLLTINLYDKAVYYTEFFCSSVICRNIEFPTTYTAESKAYSQLPANHGVITLDCNQPRYYQTRVNSG